MRPRPLPHLPVRADVLRTMAVVAVLTLLTAGCGQASGTHSTETPPVAAQTPPPGPTPATPPAHMGAADNEAVPDGEPARVVIPAISVDASLVPVGLADDGSMQVPEFGIAGWYTEGPRPGHPGPSVVVAHVDSRAGPDVFHRLGELTLGDEIHVVYDDGDHVTFLVESSTQTPKAVLPVDDIWPLTRQRMLTLITCGGAFDRSSGHYQDNIIVYTTPALPAIAGPLPPAGPLHPAASTASNPSEAT